MLDKIEKKRKKLLTFKKTREKKIYYNDELQWKYKIKGKQSGECRTY